MVSTLPTPVAAALGVLPTVLGGVRRLPGRAIALPAHALDAGITKVGKARRTYDELAERGEAVVSRLRGEAGELVEDISDRADELEDRLEDLLTDTPVAGLYDAVEDGLEDATEAVKARVSRSSSLVEDLKDELEVPEAEQPKGVPTPKAPSGEVERVDTAATADVVAVVEQVAAGASPVLSHDELPLPDYDHMTLGSLRGRLRSLTVDELVAVRAYEKAHADRLPVITMLDNRIARLSTDPTAQPSGGPASDGPSPKASKPVKASKSKVTPATSAEPTGTPVGAKPGLPLN